MATSNIQVTGAWTLIIPSAATKFLVSCDYHEAVEYATGADDSTDPTVAIGHRLKSGEGLNRALIDGSLFARAVAKNANKAVILAVDSDALPS
jgi:hypothetical protein